MNEKTQDVMVDFFCPMVYLVGPIAVCTFVFNGSDGATINVFGSLIDNYF